MFLAIFGSGGQIEEAQQLLEAQGFSSVTIDGSTPVIPEGYEYGIRFRAIGPTGAEVTGTVYGSYQYGKSIRFD